MADHGAWQAVVRASSAVDALRDALFVADEVRYASDAIWSGTDAGTGSLLVRLDDARSALRQARGDADGALKAAAAEVKDDNEPLKHSEPTASTALATLKWPYMDACSRADALDRALEHDHMLVVLHDVCVQGERLMNSLQATLAQKDPAALDAMREHHVPACRRVIATLCSSVAHVTRVDVRQRVSRIHLRWEALQRRVDVDVEDASAALATLSLTPGAKRRAPDANALHAKFPRTPSQLPQHATFHFHVRTDRSVSASTPTHAPQWTGAMAPSTPDLTRPRSVLDRLPDVPVTPRTSGTLTRPPSATRSTTRSRVRRRESMLPRLSHTPVPPLPAQFASETRAATGRLSGLRAPSAAAAMDPHGDQGPDARALDAQPLSAPRTPRVRRQSSIPQLGSAGRSRPSGRMTPGRHTPGLPVRSTPSASGHSPGASVGRRTPTQTGRHTPTHNLRYPYLGPRSAYMPNPHDPLDIGVARVCNARSVPVERADDAAATDMYHRYTMLTKTVACRLLPMVRTCARATNASTDQSLHATSTRATCMCASVVAGSS